MAKRDDNDLTLKVMEVVEKKRFICIKIVNKK
jgi:hypothetical protein